MAENSDENLTPSQTEKLLQFQVIYDLIQLMTDIISYMLLNWFINHMCLDRERD